MSKRSFTRDEVNRMLQEVKNENDQGAEFAFDRDNRSRGNLFQFLEFTAAASTPLSNIDLPHKLGRKPIGVVEGLHSASTGITLRVIDNNIALWTKTNVRIQYTNSNVTDATIRLVVF